MYYTLSFKSGTNFRLLFGNLGKSKCWKGKNQALHFYVGIHKFAPNLAINWDIGTVSIGIRHKVEMFLYWNRLMEMESHQIRMKIFTWDFEQRRSVGNWNSDSFKVFSTLNIVELYNNLLEIDLKLH